MVFSNKHKKWNWHFIHQSYVIQRINGIIMKFGVSAKKYMIGVFVKMWNRTTWNCECNKAFEIDEYINIKRCLCKNVYLVD